MSVLELVRPDLRDFAGYASARRTQARGSVWLNANESPSPSTIDPSRRLHRYPEPQPAQLRERLARYYGVEAEQLAITRGSDEGIDLLVRALCRPGIDSVGVCSPGFGMYAVSAALQGAPLVDVPLQETAEGFAWDFAGLRCSVLERGVRLLFLCSPANPTGQALPTDALLGLLEALRGRAVVVVDEAYAEFSSRPSAIALLTRFPELVVLRTLSKAHALAGARVGALLADPRLVALLRNLSAPYPIATPSAELAWRALAPIALQRTQRRVAATVRERERLRARLQALAGVRVHASEANFLLARFAAPDEARTRLAAAGIVVRDMSALRGLDDALRITVGSRRESEALLAALGALA
jgi:histidinol-phosphate aminotransferase